jgi:hypothetical protein
MKDLWKGYKKGSLSPEDLSGSLYSLALSDRKLFRLEKLREDECFDFLGWFYPRFALAAERFTNERVGFDNYMIMVLRYSLLEYLRLEREGRMAESVMEKPHSGEDDGEES